MKAIRVAVAVTSGARMKATVLGPQIGRIDVGVDLGRGDVGVP
jgi:hypothetical protein